MREASGAFFVTLRKFLNACLNIFLYLCRIK
nr:MAG TPA: hypothetical protein [Caudoviricetes sp.]